jgi:hypothetical protein
VLLLGGLEAVVAELERGVDELRRDDLVDLVRPAVALVLASLPSQIAKCAERQLHLFARRRPQRVSVSSPLAGARPPGRRPNAPRSEPRSRAEPSS